MSEISTSPEIFEKCTDTIIRQVNDIGRMVDEFSSFARMPKPVINCENLNEIIKSALFPQKVTFPDIEFGFEEPVEPVFANCDGRLIVQALSNLLKNASESIEGRLADHKNLEKGAIKIELECIQSMAFIHIVDNGLGLPASDRARLAEPYITTRAKGTGLGLAIVKKVAEEHDGSLVFSDDHSLGETGARVTFSLPIVSEAIEVKNHAAE